MPSPTGPTVASPLYSSGLKGVFDGPRTDVSQNSEAGEGVDKGRTGGLS